MKLATFRGKPKYDSPSLGGMEGDDVIRRARTCYDHLAGRLGVALSDALIRQGVLDQGTDLDGDHWYELTDRGRTRLDALGVQLEHHSRRPLLRSCLDWTERRPHVAGLLGARLLDRFESQGWIVRASGRAVRVSDGGRRELMETFGVPATAFD